jgi:hypothetical protein
MSFRIDILRPTCKASPRLDLVFRVLNELEIRIEVFTRNESRLADQRPPLVALDIDAIARYRIEPKAGSPSAIGAERRR